MFKIDESIKMVCSEAFTRFIGSGLYVGLFFIAIVYVISNMRKTDDKENRIKIVIGVYSIIILILNLSPFFTKFITSILKETSTYWRVYWLLPIGIAIAFMFTEIICKKDNKKDRIIITILIACVIILSGKYMYNSYDSEKFIKVDNYYKVPKNVLDIIQYISADDSEYKKLAGGEIFIVYTRQIDGTIILPESRNVNGIYSENSIITLVNKGNIKEIYDYCNEKKCNYLVLNRNIEFPKEYIFENNIKNIYGNEEYMLYKFEF